MELAVTFAFESGKRHACAIDRVFGLIEGPTITDVTTLFGPATTGTARVRLSDRADRVVDVTPMPLGAYDFKGYVAVVPVGFVMDRATAYNGAGHELRTASLRRTDP